MEIKKYPEYVTTDSDFWNSADESHFYVSKNTAKKLPSILTPIIEDALNSGLLREATQEEIDEHLLEDDVNKKIREGRISAGNTWKESVDNYNQWKESQEKQKEEKPKIPETKIDEKPKDKQPEINPTQNAINQKPSISTKSL